MSRAFGLKSAAANLAAGFYLPAAGLKPAMARDPRAQPRAANDLLSPGTPDKLVLRHATETSEPSALKALGRIAYCHLRDAEIYGNITVGGEEERIRVLEEDELSAKLLEAFPGTPPTDYSQILIRCGRKVLDIRWDRAGSFKAVAFEPDGEWQKVLIDLPEPIPL